MLKIFQPWRISNTFAEIFSFSLSNKNEKFCWTSWKSESRIHFIHVRRYAWSTWLAFNSTIDDGFLAAKICSLHYFLKALKFLECFSPFEHWDSVCHLREFPPLLNPRRRRTELSLFPPVFPSNPQEGNGKWKKTAAFLRVTRSAPKIFLSSLQIIPIHFHPAVHQTYISETERAACHEQWEGKARKFLLFFGTITAHCLCVFPPRLMIIFCFPNRVESFMIDAKSSRKNCL